MNELLSELSNFQQILSVALIAAVAVQLFYLLFFYIRLVVYKPKNSLASQPPVSIVICARNESKNLMNYIPMIMEQNYPLFEVVVVNDSSWDDSEDILKALQVRYPSLKVVKLNEDLHRMAGKKFALTMGIKGTSHERLLLTDADCSPLSNDWITNMLAEVKEDEVVLGVSLMAREKGVWKNFFRFESVHTAVNYCSLALGGLPYMGVGRNLSYTKEKFFSVGGFRKHMHIIGGDDDLFINEIAPKSTFIVRQDLEAQTTSLSPEKLSKWWEQKRRHLNTSGLYKFKHKLALGMEPLSWWIMWGTALVLLVLRTPALLVITPIAFRYLLLYGTFIAIGRKWKVLDAVWVMPIWELALNIAKPAVLLSNMISKPKRWM
tara:strand:- start:6012 stop:7142 length:1131 start_codon:yes stop_codon:yes gene_type:complete